MSTQPRYIHTAIALLVALVSAPALAQRPELVVQTGHYDKVNSVAFSPDGQTIASGSDDGTVKLWDASSGALLRTLVGHEGRVEAVAFHPGGQTIMSASSDRTIRIWDAATGALRRTIRSTTLDGVAFSPDGKLLAALEASGEPPVVVYDATTFEELRSIPTKLGGGSALAFAPDGKTLAVGGVDESGESGIVLFLDAVAGKELRQLKGHAGSVEAVAFSPDGRMLASGGKDGKVILREAASGRVALTCETKVGEVKVITFAPDGRRFAVAGESRNVELRDSATGALVSTLSNKRNSWVRSLAFSPDGRRLASGTSIDDAIIVWDVASGEPAREMLGRLGQVADVAFSPDARTLAVRRANRQLTLWDLGEGAARQLNEQVGEVGRFVFSPDGRSIITARYGYGEAALSLIDAATGVERRRFPVVKLPFTFALSPDGKLVAAATRESVGGDDDKSTYPIILWDAGTGAQVRKLKGHARWVTSIVFSPDSRLIATVGDASSKGDNAVKLWDAATGAEVRSIPPGERNSVNYLAFSRDGKLLAGACRDKTVRLWDATTGAQLRAFVANASGVTAIAFSPDGKILASGGFDGAVTLWDADAGQELATLRVADENKWVVTTPEGLFDSAGDARTLLLWRYSPALGDVAPLEAFDADLHAPKLLAAALSGKRPPAPRELSAEEIAARVRQSGEAQAAAAREREAAEQKAEQEAAPSDERPRVFVQIGHTGGVGAVALSPDGRVVASVSGDKIVRLWDAESERELRALRGLDPEGKRSFSRGRLAFTPDGGLLVAGGAGDVVVWSVETGELVRRFAHAELPSLSGDGKLLALSTGTRIVLRRMPSGESVREITDTDAEASYIATNDLALSPDGKVLAVSSANGVNGHSVRLLDAETGALLRVIEQTQVQWAANVAFSPDGQTLATADRVSWKLWDVATGKLLRTATPAKLPIEETKTAVEVSISGVAFSSDGRRLAVSTDRGVELWDAREGRFIRAVPEDRMYHEFESVAFSRDGSRLVAGAKSGAVRLWLAADGREVATLAGRASRISQLAFSPDGRTMVTGWARPWMWDLRAGAIARTYDAIWNSAAFVADGKSLIGAATPWAQRLNLATGEMENLSLMGMGLGGGSLAVSADGRLAAGYAKAELPGYKIDEARFGRLSVISTETGAELKLLEGKVAALSASISSDNKLLASALSDGTIKVWDTTTGRVAQTLKVKNLALTGPELFGVVAFSPKEGLLAGDGDYGWLNIWETQGWGVRRLKMGAAVGALAFSPDGRLLAAALVDGSVALLDPASGERRRTLRGHVSPVSHIAFTPDGKLLATASSDETIKFWDASSGEELLTLVTAGRNDWLVVTPDGLFDGTPGAFAQIQWRFSKKTLRRRAGRMVLQRLLPPRPSRRTVRGRASARETVGGSGRPPTAARANRAG